MAKRELNNNIEPSKYFVHTEEGISKGQEEGIRDMYPLLPFVISGGSNTERYYFKHISDTTKYKFIIKPEYFADESSYTDIFPQRIAEILSKNKEAKIFCVFDWDTIYNNQKRLEKHAEFESKFEKEIATNVIILCPTMPCIEYWFLLHFINHTDLLKNYSKVSQLLAPHIKPCFLNPDVGLRKLLKREEYLKNSEWVENLSKDGKLENAIIRAENNIINATKKGTIENESYSFVYKMFK